MGNERNSGASGHGSRLIGSRGRLAGAFALVLAAWAAIPAAAGAATIDVACGDVAALRAAIVQANTTTEPDTIEVTGAPCNFDVANAAVTAAAGDTGLPVIIRPLTINGNGATVRRTGATNYRLFFASTPDFVAIPRVELNDLTIASGRLTGTNQNGAGVAGFLADIVLNRVVLSANQAGGRGGAVGLAGGSLDMNRSVAGSNVALFGAAIYAANTAGSNNITRSSFYFNHATGNSGTMLIENANAVVENSTVAANSAANGSGGITAFTSAAAAPASVVVRSSTLGDNGVFGNTAPGTSLWTVGSAGPATITATDTIVVDTDSSAAPVSAPCVETGGEITDSGGSVEWPTTSCGFGTEANPRVSYQFGGLGGVEIFAKLLRGSAAIDNGGQDCPAVDQRGISRPAGEACDSGSWETQPPDTFAEAPSPTNDPQVTFTSSAPNSTFECRVNGGEWQTCTSPFDPGPLSDGEHSVDVRAISAQGDVDPTPASVSFVVDQTAPTVSVDPVDSPAQPVEEITFTVEDQSAIESVTCQVDDSAPVDCQSPFTTPELAPGSHEVTVRATDAAGNTGSDSVTFSIPEPQQTTTKECGQRRFLLGMQCAVTFSCPADNSGCAAKGEIEVSATQVTGIVRGDVKVVTPSRTAKATCGSPAKLVPACSAKTDEIVVEPGEDVTVTCDSRQLLSIGLIYLNHRCVGTFTRNILN